MKLTLLFLAMDVLILLSYPVVFVYSKFHQWISSIRSRARHLLRFRAMRALGANLDHLRRFLFAEALAISGLSLVIGAGMGILLARLLVMLLGVIFTIPARVLSWDWLGLLTLAAFVISGMVASVAITSRRLSTLKVVEALREL